MTDNTPTATQSFAVVTEVLTQEPGVSQSERKGFGHGGLMANDKLFALLKGDRLLVKLPVQMVSKLISAGFAEQMERNGKLMKEWVFVQNVPTHDWLNLARQAKLFVMSGK